MCLVGFQLLYCTRDACAAGIAFDLHEKAHTFKDQFAVKLMSTAGGPALHANGRFQHLFEYAARGLKHSSLGTHG